MLVIITPLLEKKMRTSSLPVVGSFLVVVVLVRGSEFQIKCIEAIFLICTITYTALSPASSNLRHDIVNAPNCLHGRQYRWNPCWKAENWAIQWYRAQVCREYRSIFLTPLLRPKLTSRTAENFRQLCTGEFRCVRFSLRDFGTHILRILSVNSRPQGYKGATFHR